MGIEFLYGIEGNWTPVNKELFRVKDGYIIPESDLYRAHILGDPIPNVLKSLKVIFNENDSIIVDLSSSCYIKEDGSRNSIDSKLYDLHKRYILTAGSFAQEYPEQLMAIQFIKTHNKVLEIGGNIGRNSLIISSILDNESNLLVLESDRNICSLLEKNRDNNGSKFQIMNAALSNKKLYQRGWNTCSFENPPEGWTEINTIGHELFHTTKNLNFDTLVLDCEGAFYQILMEDDRILDGIKTILVENDYENIDQFIYVKKKLVNHGFKLIYSKPLENYSMPCQDFFYQVYVK